MFRRLLPLAVATFAVTTDSLVIAGLLRPIADTLDVSVSTAGQLVSVFSLTFAIAAPVLGAATANLDRRTVLLLAIGVFVLGNVVAAVGTEFAIVMAARVISALGAALISSIAMATASALAPPDKQGRALALVTAGMTVATTMGVPLGTLIGGADWRITLWAVAGLGTLAGAGIWLGLPKVELPVAPLRDRLKPLGDPGILAILAVTLMILTSGYTLYTYIGVATDAATGGTASGLMAVLIAYGVGSILGNVISGFLTDRYRPVRVLLVGLVMLTAILAITPLVSAAGLFLTMAWATTWGISGWLTGLPQQHRLVTKAPESSAILLGLNASTLHLGIAIGGGIGGLILNWGNTVLLGLMSAAIVAIGLAITLVSTRGRVTEPEPVPASAD
ncbi:MFS transporter [Stackebrandtia nassauensis]|uniref:Major facilitator superfamily MFS_1 n=1 Tax=Stackebrandtia nassauensis (strain DSM 44728 / CIP 108903 / NRRL B-16338 / NBRC 102104 / LLR-40K-21) TaxID=446470 RepID=D3PXD0_STANL|nr:MFS transporter [Stackebrandtia nassauensis]ADD41393.1 major facilitator superfamily MFS_1 [Stackebrandtia nassauensis DSM 44728]